MRGALHVSIQHQISSSVCHTHHCWSTYKDWRLSSPSLGNACLRQSLTCIIHRENKFVETLKEHNAFCTGQPIAFYTANYLLFSSTPLGPGLTLSNFKLAPLPHWSVCLPTSVVFSASRSKRGAAFMDYKCKILPENIYIFSISLLYRPLTYVTCFLKGTTDRYIVHMRHLF